MIDVHLQGIAWDAVSQGDCRLTSQLLERETYRQGTITGARMLPARRLIIAVFGVCLLTALLEVSKRLRSYKRT